jgi:hypothetical protein
MVYFHINTRSGGIIVVRIILLIMILVGSAAAGDNFKEQDIIIIERNLNKNEVHYAVRVEHGRIDQEEPIVAYWIMKEKGGIREDLNWIERKAYGFNIKKDKTGDFYYMTLKGYDKRSIKVLVQDGHPKAEIGINKAPAYFEKMYIYAVGSGFIPDIKYIELKGKDVKTGIHVSERIIP